MMITSTSLNNTLAEKLVQIWAERYVLDLSTLSLQENPGAISQFMKVASTEGRTKTVAHLKRLVQINCERAGIQTDILFSYIPNVVNLTEAPKLAQYAWQVYEKALGIYEQHSPLSPSLTTDLIQNGGTVYLSSNVFTQQAMSTLNIAALKQLVIGLDPVIEELRKQLLSAKDSRTLGFMSTQFHFSTELVLKRLTPPEQVLLKPYFQFIEEQVCIPLQRICFAAANYYPGSPTLALVEQLLSVSRDVAYTVYHRAVKLYRNHRSLRGGLSEPGVMDSTIRDLQMFQAYLLLCVLEGNMTAIEHELIPLSVLVFPSVDVKWELIKKILQLLVDELMNRVNQSQKSLLLPYTQAIEQLFSNIEKKAS